MAIENAFGARGAQSAPINMRAQIPLESAT